MSERWAHGSSVAWTDTAPGIKRQILGYGDDLMLTRVDFEAGAIGTMHHHPHRQGTYVVSGRFEVTIDGEARTLVAGDSFFVAAEFEHGVRALDQGTLIDAFSPARADFLAAQ